jgi:precorrin-6A/cobalt-precorrin-6A reductase
MGRERIEVVVTKNSGGAATYPKMAAARALGLPVIVVTRPEKPATVREVETAEAAFAWLQGLHERTP